MASKSGNEDVESGTGFLSKESTKTVNNEGTLTAKSGGSRLFRCFTVFMYVSLVSGLGLIVSLYHLFVWDSTMPPVANVPGHEIY